MLRALLGIVKKILKIPIKIALFPIKTLIASLLFYLVILLLVGGGIYRRSRPSASGLDPEAVHLFVL